MHRKFWQFHPKYMNMNKNYPAKLILFGEYTVINNSEALAIPFRLFDGKWEFDSQNLSSAKDSSEKLFEILSYLERNNFEGLDLLTFKTDITNGIWFNSNIPFGYGLGSSGSLSAAIYDRYVVERTSDLIGLRTILGRIESFFHGTSSGTDPLVSYLNKPIKINEDQSVSILSELKNNEEGETLIYVIDCGFARKSEKLVTNYLENCADRMFIENYVEPMQKQVKNCIDEIISGNNEFKDSIKIISKLQLAHMKAMIPIQIQKLWKEGIDTEKFSLKLCGAGGGGFMLAFCYDRYELNFGDFTIHKVITL